MPSLPHEPIRRPTYPLAHSFRRKPRRVPLVLRLAHGSIHSIVILPVLLHSLFTVLVVYLDRNVDGSLGLPSTIIPSLSIVVGLMLVFRNSTSYDRFWTGRNCLTTISTSVRNLSRIILINASKGLGLSKAEQAETEKIIRVLLAILYAIKHNLRAEFNIPPASIANDQPPSPDSPSSPTLQTPRRPITTLSRRNSLAEEHGIYTASTDYTSLLPPNLLGYEDRGLSLPLQLTLLVERYIHLSHNAKSWVHAPLASQMTVQLNSLVDAYGRMETIRSTPLPIAHLIHQKQVLALFTCFLPFTIVDDYGWYAVPIVAIIAFTLYGIDGIGGELEDPFGYDRNDIKMDGIVEDARREVMVLLEEWRDCAEGRGNGAVGGMFE
ncbi:hypothetical protein BU24DRAFT_443673 [Aaosphaeria arxii CBS 175.79]|uniref:Uncharacterized protein n=1 Tax=Aaosphaeria arxii CBS 175.79 TaxID=1450172 RepID=A0A6A5XEE8_9PLEO|nr:uncharacterized protein BU24DRAFT_443673 [Aaosphaeria arxii CBS 175.79]KAF2011259.1 hypothetical protein BU24DRAFT_443673 [Aaosphaeria arxii CBS 175.79]